MSQGRQHGPGGHGGHGAGLGKRPSKSKEPKRLLIPSFSQGYIFLSVNELLFLSKSCNF